MRTVSLVGLAYALIIALGLKSFAGEEISHAPRRPLSSSSYEPILTEHFLIRHDNPEWAREVATHIESAFQENYEKWFPDRPRQQWQSRCEVLLFNDPQDYHRKTGQGSASHGHSQCIKSSGKIICREISLQNCNPQLQKNIRKHEIMHVLLAGSNTEALPRWADEGLAVLSEDISIAHSHLRNLSRSSSKLNFSAKELIHMNEYPEGKRWPALAGLPLPSGFQLDFQE